MRRLTLLLLLLSLPALCAQATHITVSGNVSGVWDVDTVLVAGEVHVPVGQSLTIQPGAQIIFQGNYKFIVDTSATLIAMGTPQDSIVFTVANIEIGWRGIRFIFANNVSLLRCCNLQYGKSSYLPPWILPDNSGGAIFCDHSSPTIERCKIRHCYAYYGGGAIACWHSSPVIASNLISGNTSVFVAGGIHCWSHSNPMIQGNVIISNQCSSSESAIACEDTSSPYIYGNVITSNGADSGTLTCLNRSDAAIVGNIIHGNTVASTWGGIGCDSSDPMIVDNYICGNTAATESGLSIVSNSHPTVTGNFIFDNGNNSGSAGVEIYQTYSFNFTGNIIHHNSSWSNTGGILSSTASLLCLYRNTVFGNISHEGFPGGLYLFNQVQVRNCVVWSNSSPQMQSPSYTVTYCNIEGGFFGSGNLNQYPAFVDTAYNDYRLLWGSPCIDSGNPDSLDPDGTRSDMGAFYFDQSVPVHVLLTPHQIPYLIPATGGSMDFTLRLYNWSTAPHTIRAWCNITYPDSTVFGPVLGPITVTIPASTMIARVRTQAIPASAPLGVYHYNAYAVVRPDTSKDSFMFGKLGAGGMGMGAGNWANTGEDFQVEFTASGEIHPSSFDLHPCYPNPFNAMTVIRYQMPDARNVSLRVYDTAGRLVTTLVHGWREAGAHEVTFDGSNLTSGLYFVRMLAGDFSAVQKIILMK